MLGLVNQTGAQGTDDDCRVYVKSARLHVNSM
jgi:hypothetical protein